MSEGGEGANTGNPQAIINRVTRPTLDEKVQQVKETAYTKVGGGDPVVGRRRAIKGMVGGLLGSLAAITGFSSGSGVSTNPVQAVGERTLPKTADSKKYAAIPNPPQIKENLAPKIDPNQPESEHKDILPPPGSPAERNVFGKLKIPETKEGVTLKMRVEAYDKEGRPIPDPDPAHAGQTLYVEVEIPHVRQYLDKAHGGIGEKQYSYAFEPDGNSTFVGGSPDKPLQRELNIRAHSGIDNRDGVRKVLPAEPLKDFHYKVYDANTGTYRPKTAEEQRKFRDDTRFKISMEWSDGGTQVAEATMHRVPADNMVGFWEQFRDHNQKEGPERPPNPRLVDFTPEEERRRIPTQFTPEDWQNHANFHFCGESDPGIKPGQERNEAIYLHMHVLDESEEKKFQS